MDVGSEHNFWELKFGCQARLISLVVFLSPVFSVVLSALCFLFEKHLLASGFLFPSKSLLFYVPENFM